MAHASWGLRPKARTPKLIIGSRDFLHWATATLAVYTIIKNAEITGALFDAQQLPREVIFSIVLSAVLVVQFVWIQFWGDGHDFLPMRPAWNVMHHEPCMY